MSDTDTQTPPQPAASVPTRAEIMQQIAQIIVKRRKERDLTLEKVTQAIKIRLPYLNSIEKGAWDELPGEVYVRGFVRRYADFLGLDTVVLMAPYLAAQSPAVEATPSSNMQLSSDVNRMQFLWIGLIGIFIVVFIKLIQKERTAPLKSIATMVSTTTAVTATSVAPAPSTAHVALLKHSLEVFSPFPLWLRVSASDKTFEGFIPQASSWTWKGEGTFTVRFGHTKQVVLSFDGENVPLIEDQKSITLPHAN